MAILVRVGGEWKTLTGTKVFSGGSWRSLKAILVYIGGAWQTVANFTPAGPSGGGGGAMSLTVSRNPCQGTSASSTVTTRSCTVTPSGGAAPFTYAWSITSFTGTGSPSINSPSAATTSFTKTGVPINSEIDAVAKCDVTDSLGVTASITVNVQFIHETGGIE